MHEQNARVGQRFGVIEVGRYIQGFERICDAPTRINYAFANMVDPVPSPKRSSANL